MIKIAIFGDICPIDNLEPFRFHVSDDYVIGNLECALADTATPIKKVGPVLNIPVSFSQYLKSSGFTAVSLANNHIRDCGDNGVASTIDGFRSNGVSVFGAGKTPDLASKPYLIEREGKKIIILSFAEKEFNYVNEGRYGANVFDPYVSFDRINAAKASADVVIVLYHGGVEYYKYPSPELQRKCRKMVDSGADVVLCQHSHCIGTRERYGNGEVLYGQGNSVFGYKKNDSSWNHGLLAHVTVSDSGVKVSYEVMETAIDGSVSIAEERVAKDVLGRLSSESESIQNQSFVQDEWKRFCDSREAFYLAMLYGFGANTNRLNRLLHNGLINLLFHRRQKNATHNLIRCDAHREVVETILGKYDFE